jgi:glycosyltransferase involved in cell wall biosynthesis
MILSILIPTLESRKTAFAALHEKLEQQVASCGRESQVEILSDCDDGRQPTGTKRNSLLSHAAGEFVVFVDDDDEVSADYVALICRAIESDSAIDCIGIKGTITFQGSHPRTFVHSLRYQDYSSEGGTYKRPPYHLNPIRRSIAASHRFLDVYYSEDIEWALRIREQLKTEVFLEPVLYHYRSRRYWPYQWLLDHTEAVRHRLGLRLTNRFQIYSLLRRVAGSGNEETS